MTDSITAAISENQKIKAYRIYVTDGLYVLCKMLGGGMKHRYYDLLHPKEEDDRSGDEIAKERLERFGVKVVTFDGFI